MKIKQLIAAGVAAAAVMIGTPVIAQADDPIVVTATDVDATSNTCFPSAIRITGLTRTTSPYVIAIYGPVGAFGFGTSWGGFANTPPFEFPFCSDNTEGHYTIMVDGVVQGGFEVYRPHIDAAPIATAAARGKAHRVVGRMSIHGQAMPGTRVTMLKHVSGRRGIRAVILSTDARGAVRATCPRGHRCTVQFDYGNGFALSRLVRVGRK